MHQTAELGRRPACNRSTGRPLRLEDDGCLQQPAPSAAALCSARAVQAAAASCCATRPERRQARSAHPRPLQQKAQAACSSSGWLCALLDEIRASRPQLGVLRSGAAGAAPPPGWVATPITLPEGGAACLLANASRVGRQMKGPLKRLSPAFSMRPIEARAVRWFSSRRRLLAAQSAASGRARQRWATAPLLASWPDASAARGHSSQGRVSASIPLNRAPESTRYTARG